MALATKYLKKELKPWTVFFALRGTQKLRRFRQYCVICDSQFFLNIFTKMANIRMKLNNNQHICFGEMS
jgi:hypothetical protein